MKILRSKSFWLVLASVNITSGLICAFCGSLEGTITCILSLGACIISYNIAEIP